MTGYGFTGPMTERGTVFADKAAADPGPGGASRMLLLGVGCWLLFMLGVR